MCVFNTDVTNIEFCLCINTSKNNKISSLYFCLISSLKFSRLSFTKILYKTMQLKYLQNFPLKALSKVKTYNLFSICLYTLLFNIFI